MDHLAKELKDKPRNENLSYPKVSDGRVLPKRVECNEIKFLNGSIEVKKETRQHLRSSKTTSAYSHDAEVEGSIQLDGDDSEIGAPQGSKSYILLACVVALWGTHSRG